MKKLVPDENRTYGELIQSESLDSADLAQLSGGFSWGETNHVSWTPEPEGRKLPLRISRMVTNLVNAD